MNMIMNIVLAALALMTVGLLKSYRNLPEHELRRRSREGDELASALFRAVSYGSSLGAVLWLLVVIANALFFVYIARSSPTWFAIVASAALIWYAFVWMPAREVTKFSTWVAVKLAPALAWLLNYLHPLLNKVVAFVDKHRPVTMHTGIYSKQELIDLIHNQKNQPGNRIDKSVLDIATHSLSFGDLQVRDVMVPRRSVKMVKAEDTTGPVLMKELHDSGFSRFPVYSGKKENLLGILYMKDLLNSKSGGNIDKIIQNDLVYIHEDQSLTDALQAILKTHRHQYIVVNRFEEFVGIITLEDVLEQIVGRPIIDEFDKYDDVRAVAAHTARVEHEAHTKEEKNVSKEALAKESPDVLEESAERNI